MKLSKKPKPARPKTRSALRRAAVVFSLLASCGNEVRTPPAPEPARVEIPRVEDVGDCIDRYFESDLAADPSFGRISRDRMSREMRESARELFSRMDEEMPERYEEYFRKARFSNGDLMFPNAADVVSGGVFPDEKARRLAGRRLAKSMRPARFPNTYALLHSMPKTAVALVDRVNRSQSGMDVRHAEDIAGFFRALIGFQNRMGEKQRVCDFVPNMSREQLNELDSYYSDKIIRWNNPVTGQKVCAHCKGKIESGDFARFGLAEFPEGMESAFCR